MTNAYVPGHRYDNEKPPTQAEKAVFLRDDVRANVTNLARAMARCLVNDDSTVDFDAAVKCAYDFITNHLMRDDYRHASITGMLTNGFIEEVHGG